VSTAEIGKGWPQEEGTANSGIGQGSKQGMNPDFFLGAMQPAEAVH
jgi:hypothetical protein